MLINLIIQGIKISKTLSLEDVVNFKKRHRDELGLFRTNISKLTKDIPKNTSIEAFKQQIEDVYNDEFLPAYNNFKKSLDGAGVKWTADNFMKVSFFSTSATAIPMTLLGLSLPQALLAGAGVSVISSLVSYNVDKKDKLRSLQRLGDLRLNSPSGLSNNKRFAECKSLRKSSRRYASC